MAPVTTDEFSPNVAELTANNARQVEAFESREHAAPSRNLAVVTCMDARIDPYTILGLEEGEAHIMRNAGGVVTDDVIRSLCLSQRALGTREVIIIHHSDCGLQGVDEAGFRAEMQSEVGVKPPWSLESFADPFEDVRQSIQRLLVTPFLPHKENISGFVYDVNDGLLHTVD